MLRKISLLTFLVASSVFNCSVSQVLAQNGPNTSNPNPVVESSVVTSPAESATVLYAVVSGGNLIRGSGAVKSDNLGTGYYEVIFDRNVTKCAYNATLGRPDSSGVDGPGMITVVGRAGNPNGVFIATYDADGHSINRNFHLSSLCPSK